MSYLIPNTHLPADATHQALQAGNLKTSGGFTLLETLVAIAILMMAIGSAFDLAPRGLVGVRFAKNQTTATYLAQEAIEVIHNLRDNSMLFSNEPSDPLHWLQNVSQCIDQECAVDALGNTAEPCSSSGCPRVKVARGDNGTILYGTNFGGDSPGDLDLGLVGIGVDPDSVRDTIYTRSVMITKVYNNVIGRDDTEIIVTAKVNWTNGKIEKETKISERLFDWATFTK